MFELLAKLDEKRITPHDVCYSKFFFMIHGSYFLRESILRYVRNPDFPPGAIATVNLSHKTGCVKTRGGNLRPAWTFDMSRIKIFVTQVRVQHHAKTKLHDKQVLRQ